jgi:hypothetical protein
MMCDYNKIEEHNQHKILAQILDHKIRIFEDS